MPSKYNLEIDKISNNSDQQENLSSIENSLTRAEKIIDDLDKRVSNITSADDAISYFEKRRYGSSTSSVQIGDGGANEYLITFNNLKKNTYYRATYSVNSFIDLESGNTYKDADVECKLQLYNSADSFEEDLLIHDFVFDQYGGSVSGDEHYGMLKDMKYPWAGSTIFKPTLDSCKLKLYVNESNYWNVFVIPASTFVILEELPNHKEITDGRWD